MQTKGHRVCLFWEAAGCNAKPSKILQGDDLVFVLLCKILGFHGCDYEKCCLLGCYAMWLL
jgi:hypothetical protein